MYEKLDLFIASFELLGRVEKVVDGCIELNSYFGMAWEEEGIGVYELVGRSRCSLVEKENGIINRRRNDVVNHGIGVKFTKERSYV